MTISSYNLVMKEVRIAELKAKLSEHLRAVRRGHTITVFDRDVDLIMATHDGALAMAARAHGMRVVGV